MGWYDILILCILSFFLGGNLMTMIELGSRGETRSKNFCHYRKWAVIMGILILCRLVLVYSLSH